MDIPVKTDYEKNIKKPTGPIFFDIFKGVDIGLFAGDDEA